MSRGRTERVCLILAVALGTRAASAAEGDVTVRCVELSEEDAAQVEARVRANLLSAGLEPATVELSCAADSARTQVTGNGQQVTRSTARSASSVKDALLASADSALAAWSAPPAPPPASLPFAAPIPIPIPTVEPGAPAARPTAPATAPTPPPARIPDARPALRSNPARASTWLVAGPRAELWSNGSGLGAQLGLQQKLGSLFLAIHSGYLLSLPTSTRFSARELQVGSQIGWEPHALLGLRGALGVGLSLFSASPGADVSVQSGGTSSTLPFLSVELSRPIEFGSFALLPATGLRVFTRSRAVLVDGEEVLALPALAFEASLSLALKVGG